ncbi:hypothetical protein Tco_0971350 [Tanacetum coccineum]
MYEVLERHTANLIEKYSVLPGPESIQNQESEKSPKEIIKAKKEQEDVETRVHLLHQSANKNTTNYRLYHALMEALLADEDAMEPFSWDQTIRSNKEEEDLISAASSQLNILRTAMNQSSAKETKDSVRLLLPNNIQLSPQWMAESQTQRGWYTDRRLTFPGVDHYDGLRGPFQKSERRATPEPEWAIPPNDFSEPEHNWENAYATTFKVPEENKLQRKTYDIGSFIKWFCRRTRKKKLLQS